MAIATDPPARVDLSMRTTDDKLVALMWRATDGTTPIAIASARMTLLLDTVAAEPVRHVIESTTPGDAGGWFEADRFDTGVALAHVPFGLWATITERTGVWDVVAVSVVDTVTRCLARGEFVVEEGI